MSGKKHTKKWLFIALWSIAVCTGLFFVLVAFRSSENKTCSAITVEIAGLENEHYITENEIRSMIADAGVAEKMPVANINIRMLEEKLERNPWIHNAELFIDKNSALNVKVYEKTPVLRVFDIKDKNYYLDDLGTIMPPVSTFSAKLPVFTGWNPQDSAFTGQMLAMAAFINKNSFWKAQVQQVDISKEHTFTILPSLGDQLIYFGDTALMEDKFNRLYLYYTRIAAKAGFSRFESLNVQFAGQIVAVNKNASGVTIDTAGAKRMVRSLMEQMELQGDSTRTTAAPVIQPDTATRVIARTPVTATPPKPQPARQAATVPRNVNAAAGRNAVTPPKPVPPKPTPPKPQPNRQPKAVMGRQG